MSRLEKCRGPGAKNVYASRALAREALRAVTSLRTGRTPTGHAYPCTWGDHWHYTTKSKRKSGGTL
jgi:hypothetical protein